MFNVEKMKKTLVAVSLSLVLVMVLSACGGSTDNTQENDRENDQVTEQPTQESPEIENEVEDEQVYDSAQEPETDWSNYPIIINGIGITDNFYMLEDFATHVPLGPVAYAIGLDVMQGGSQIAVLQDGETVAALDVVNYLTFGADRVDVGPHDTFMADDDINFTIYVPISLFRDIGFGAYSTGGHVYINDDPGDMY